MTKQVDKAHGTLGKPPAPIIQKAALAIERHSSSMLPTLNPKLKPRNQSLKDIPTPLLLINNEQEQTQSIVIKKKKKKSNKDVLNPLISKSIPNVILPEEKVSLEESTTPLLSKSQKIMVIDHRKENEQQQQSRSVNL